MKYKFLRLLTLFFLIFNICFFQVQASIAPKMSQTLSSNKTTYSILKAINASSSVSLQSSDAQNSASIQSTNVSNNSQTSDDVLVYATSSCLLDVDTGMFLFKKNADVKMFPASTTKLLTALVVLDNCNDLSEKVNVSYYSVHSVPYSYSIANLYEGESFTVDQLLHVLLIASANDAAYVLAEYIANKGNNYPVSSTESSKDIFDKSIEKFANMMNEKATSLGCTDSNFVNPNGIHNENCYTTAHDLALIGKYAYNNSTIRNIVNNVKYELPHTSIFNGDRIFQTTNTLLRKDRKTYYEYANGLKTGYTDAAKSCIIASASKGSRNLIAVILGGNSGHNDDSRDADCVRLFEYGFNNYALSQLVGEKEVVKHLSIINGTKETNQLDVYASKGLSALVKNGEAIDVTPEITINKSLAPISEGEVIGSIKYTVDNINYESNLIASHDVYVSSTKNIFIILGIIFILLIICLILISKPKKRNNKNKNRSNSKKNKNNKNSNKTFNHNKYMY